jgi:acetyl-CoA carboxylase biotin carboxyl carrier protein
MLTRAEIDDILKLIDSSDFLELKLEMGDLKLELRRPGAAPPLPNGAAQAAPALATPPPSRFAPPPAAPAPAAVAGGIDVTAPLLGTLWHQARPGDDPYVKVGDTVTADTVIGIIEVMKLMNIVPAGIAGVVTEVVAPNGKPVQYGDTLIRVRPS